VPITFLSVDQRSPNFFLFNRGGIAIDNAFHHLLTFLCIPEIFAIKVGGVPPKGCTCVNTPT